MVKRLRLVSLVGTLAVVAFYVCFGLLAYAQAPTQAPSSKYFLGPSLGEVWVPSDTYVAGFNAQTGTTYTITGADMGKVLSFANAGAIAVTLPQAGTAGFEAGKCFAMVTIGAGTATVTPTTSTINAGATKAYATGVGSRVCSNGTNYLAY